MRQISLIILLIAFGSTISFAQVNVSTEEYQIYATLLPRVNRENYESYGRNTFFVIVDRTLTLRELSEEEDLLISKVTSIKSLLKDFRGKNEQSARLLSKIPSRLKYSIQDKQLVEKLVEQGERESEQQKKEFEVQSKASGGPIIDTFGPPSWIPFYQKYEGAAGYYSFSRVGFSTDRRNALVILKKNDNWNGFTHFIRMKKLNGKWRDTKSGIISVWSS